MFSKKHTTWASTCVLLALASCETPPPDEGADASTGGQTSDGDDDGAASGGKLTGSGGKASGGAAAGGSGGTAAGGGTGGGDLGGNSSGGALGGEGNLGGAGGDDDDDDLDDGEEIGDDDPGSGTGGSDPGSGGAPAVPVSGSIKAAITKQLTPLDTNDPFLIEVGTLTYYPVKLENVEVTPPDGWVLSHVESNGDTCPRTEGGTERCRQYWKAYLYPTAGVCQFNEDQLVWTWDAACALGADCSVMPTGLPDPVQFTTTHSSEYFCEQDVDVAPFLPQTAIIKPTEGTDPVTIRYFTSLADPYRFTAGDVTVPAGMTLVDFSEASSACHDLSFPDGCRQWWDIVVDPGDACTVSGQYSVVLDVDCELGEDCDPRVTTFTNNFEFVDRRGLCD